MFSYYFSFNKMKDDLYLKLLSKEFCGEIHVNGVFGHKMYVPIFSLIIESPVWQSAVSLASHAQLNVKGR